MKKISFLILMLLVFFVALPVFAEDGEVLDVPITYEDALSIGMPIVTLLIAIAALLRSGNAAKIDQGATVWFQQRQADRDYMEKLERAYAQANENQRKIFDTFASTIKVISPYTPFGFDDEASKFMQDMRQAGVGGAGLSDKKAYPLDAMYGEIKRRTGGDIPVELQMAADAEKLE